MSTPVKKVPIHLQSAQNRLLIKNGQIVNWDDIYDSDVYIEDGRIKEIGRNLIIPGGTRIIDARGMYVMPGGIDPHTHFELEMMGAKSVDDFYQGTKAAVAGGTTTIIDFVIPTKDESLLEAYRRYRETADEKVCCDYALHVAVTSWNAKTKEEMANLVDEHGINSFKMFMAYKGLYMLRDPELIEAFKACKSVGALAMVHAENGDIIAENTKRLLKAGITGPKGHEMSRPEEVEAEAVTRACMLANQLSCPLYVSAMTSKAAAESFASAKRQEGVATVGETLASCVGTDGALQYSADEDLGRRFVTNPPLRPDPSTPAFLLQRVSENALQIIGSDNCTFNAEQKALGKDDFSKIPCGVNGVEDRMAIVWEKSVHTGIMTLQRFVAVTSTNAAKVFNMYPRKGAILVGSDADIVVWNPKRTRTISAKTHVQAVDFNIFEGMEIHGVPEYVIVNGRVCVDECELKVVHGFGRYVERKPFCPYVYGSQCQLDEVFRRFNTFPGNQNPNGHTEKNDFANSKEAGKGATLNEQAARFASHSDGKHEHQKLGAECAPTLPDSAVMTPSSKGPRLEGQRNLQDSTFSISEEIDGEEARKACIRVYHPPGGRSAGGFW